MTLESSLTFQDGHGALAAGLDAADPLREVRGLFIGSDDTDVVAYLDGNSLGRPTALSRQRYSDFLDQAWGNRLIRHWDDEWFELPLRLGDTLGRVALGAAAGQVTIGDSTTVMLYKLMRAGLEACPDRTEIVIDTENFPTDRFVAEGIAAECGKTLRWIHPDPAAGVTVEQVAEAVGPDTALVLLSHVAYRSGFLADMPAITAAVHEAGALVLWDLCHSVGVVPTELDAWGVDLAVGCTYKYLNGGPGSPAFAYVRREHQERLRQPIWGWMGAGDSFAMAEHYEPAAGIRRFISGTPPIVGMLAMQDMISLIEAAGIDEIRRKSVRLTEFAIELFDGLLAPLGVELATPRDAARRGSHITLNHPDFRAVTEQLWEEGIIPDFRPPNGLRIGLSPLSTSFQEVSRGMAGIARALGGTMP